LKFNPFYVHVNHVSEKEIDKPTKGLPKKSHCSYPNANSFEICPSEQHTNASLS